MANMYVLGGYFVPSRIENPLYSGLPAMLYFHCYVQPHTGYSLAQRIYGFPRTDKIYKSFDRFKDYFNKTDKGYESRIEPLINEIKNNLEIKALYLTTHDIGKLTRILNNPDFKKYVDGFYKRKTNENNLEQKDVRVKKLPAVNAYEIITETIGLVCTLVYRNRKFIHKAVKEDGKKLEEAYRANLSNWGDVLAGVKQFNTVVPFFKKFSDRALEKLSKLWPQSQAIIISEYVAFFNKYHKDLNK